MTLLFTKRNSISSKLLRAILGEPVSHVALNTGFYIIDSTPFGGVKTHLLYDFYEKYEVVYTIELDMEAGRKVLKAFQEASGKRYDYGAYMYLVWRSVLKVLFKKPFPDTNPWQRDDAFLCTEIGDIITDFGVDTAAYTPYRLYKHFLGKPSG